MSQTRCGIPASRERVRVRSRGGARRRGAEVRGEVPGRCAVRGAVQQACGAGEVSAVWQGKGGWRGSVVQAEAAGAAPAKVRCRCVSVRVQRAQSSR